jgi:translation elongation factor EF-1alpha
VPLPVKATRVNSIAQRADRLAFAAHRQDVVDFWYSVMMDHTADMQHRITCSVHLMDRAYGKTVQVTRENVTENRKQIVEVRWLAPDPNDHSKLIEPEPD